MWANGAREESLRFIRQFSASLSRDLQVESSENPSHVGVPKQKLTELSKLLARCYFKTGEWQVALADNWGAVSISVNISESLSPNLLQRNVEDILHSYYSATHFDPTWYKAWHTWALANFEVIGYMENQNLNHTTDRPGSGLVAHVIQAVDGVYP